MSRASLRLVPLRSASLNWVLLRSASLRSASLRLAAMKMASALYAQPLSVLYDSPSTAVRAALIEVRRAEPTADWAAFRLLVP